MVQRAVKDWKLSARGRPRKEPFGAHDYKIIEKLQVTEWNDTLCFWKIAPIRNMYNENRFGPKTDPW